MTANNAAGSAVPAPHLTTALPPDRWESSTARCITRWGNSGAVLSVDGELDAANAGQLADYVQRCAGYCQWLALDLRELAFIGTAGFSALRSIDARCAQTKVYWAMVPSVAVSRLLRVCDPDRALPTAQEVADVLTTAPALAGR